MYSILTDYAFSEYVPYETQVYLIVDDYGSIVYRTDSRRDANQTIQTLNSTHRPLEYLNHLHERAKLRDAD